MSRSVPSPTTFSCLGGAHRAGRIADQCAPMIYYRIAEIAIALSSGLTFALVGWWEIADGISRALWN
jgi:hypothetical protein